MDAQAVIHFPFDPTTPAIARTRLAAFLTLNHASTAAIDDALIVLSEMIANAVSHGVPNADGSIEVSWAVRDGLLELSVCDAGKVGELRPIELDEDSLSGRGLSIISRVADRWWVDLDHGTRVNAALTLSR